MQDTDFQTTITDFYADRKFCAHCDAYHPYLMSVAKSYCAECGHEMQLFSADDRKTFSAKLEAKKAKHKRKGGRPRKHALAKTA